MKLTDQVCSLELAKKLKELGVAQKSYFYWYTDGRNTCVETKTDYVRGVYGYGGDKDAVYSAFTVSELGEFLPDHIYEDDSTYWLWCGKMSSWEVSYRSGDGENWIYVEEKTEADARARAIIYLIVNLPIKNIGGRMTVTTEEIGKVYDEFGLDPHNVPASFQPEINRMIRSLIKARKALKKEK